MPGFLTEADKEWLREGHSRRWELPPMPRGFWRWFGIRHCRAAWRPLKAYLAFDPRNPDWASLWRAHWLAHAIWRGFA